MDARVSSTGAHGSRSGKRRSRLPAINGSGGDHTAIYYFLNDVFQGPSRAEFKAAIDDPFYEPQDRLLLKKGGRVTAHAHVTHRVMRFGSLELPVAGLGWLGTLPHCRGMGQAAKLLAAAEGHMLQTGAMLGVLRTDIPHFFRRSGWALCGRHSYSRANARAVLGELLDRGLCRRRRKRLQIRPWRRWEQDALMRIYRENLDGSHGSLLRTEAYWKWLIRRQAYDQIFVALDGPDLLDLEEITTKIVGYAVTWGEQIVELMAAPRRQKVLAELLARSCRDAIEHDRQDVLLHAPPRSRMHKVLRSAGGVHHHHEADDGEVQMVRLLAPLQLLRRMCGEFHRRAVEAELSLPLELGLAVEGKKYNLKISPSGAKAVSRRVGRDFLRLNVADFTRLLLGQMDWDRALDEGRLQASTPEAGHIGRVLFPPLPLWRPPFDDLMA